MPSGRAYRVASLAGVAGGTVAAVALANHPLAQRLVTDLPVLDRLPPSTLGPASLAPIVATAAAVVVLAHLPLFRPRPRRALDVVIDSVRRVLLAGVGLAALGYFDYTYRLPRATLLVALGILVVSVPAWLASLNRRSAVGDGPAVVVGDDPDELARVATATDLPIAGYVAPPGRAPDDPTAPEPVAAVDGGRVVPPQAGGDGTGATLPRLGGLARLDRALVDHNVAVAALAFSEPDRAEFFGALEVCHAHGVATKVHRDHADSVLVGDPVPPSEPLIDVDLEPWDWQDHVLKRAFDVCFAATGLLVLAPVMAAIGTAIYLEDGEPVLYRQSRTATFGGRFSVAKFRTMATGSAEPTPVDDEQTDRVTRVGRVLRRTHLDELPQLWSILVGRMSVVGPRAAWIREESHLEETADAWRKRWFVKPGLTGLAQINRVTSMDPETKLRYDLAYIRRQSFRYDLTIVGRQLWLLGRELASMARTRAGLGRS